MPLDDRIDGIIRLIAVGSFVGTAIAYRRRQRRPDFDPFPVITPSSSGSAPEVPRRYVGRSTVER